jgi:hypothetical protein
VDRRHCAGALDEAAAHQVSLGSIGSNQTRYKPARTLASVLAMLRTTKERGAPTVSPHERRSGVLREPAKSERSFGLSTHNSRFTRLPNAKLRSVDLALIRMTTNDTKRMRCYWRWRGGLFGVAAPIGEKSSMRGTPSQALSPSELLSFCQSGKQRRLGIYHIEAKFADTER